MRRNQLAIEMMAISQLKPAANNPRIHNRLQRRKVASHIRRFGQVRPVLVDKDATIIDGHLITETMSKLGYEDVAVVVLDGLTPAEVRAVRLATNRLPQDAKWDPQKLALEFQALIELDFDLEYTGFDQVEIDFHLDTDPPRPGELEDAPPPVDPGALAVSQPGDLWKLGGNHRVLCGDAKSGDAVARLMGGETAQHCFTDPPYNVAIAGFVSGLGRNKHREFAEASGEMPSGEFVTFLVAFLAAAAAHLADGAVLHVCMDWRHVGELSEAGRASGLRLLNICVWTKTNPGMGSFYRSQHELVFVFKKGDGPFRNNVQLGAKGRSRSNVWSYRGMNVPGNDRDDLLATHPTVKPVRLVADAILDVTKRGDIVLDPFLGSGTTLIAAEDMGRRCVGIEIDPLYVDASIRRWQAHTGYAAVHCETGEAFDDRAEAVAAGASSPSDVGGEA